MAAPSAVDALTPGYRIPNFALPVADGRTLIFYEFATGKPMLLALGASSWSPELAARFAEDVHARAQELGLQSVAVVGESSVDVDERSPSVTAIDEDGSLRRKLFGRLLDGSEGALLVADPNLRVLRGAAIESAALETSTASSGVNALIESGLRELQREREAAPSAAPVLIVPRVLSPEVCRALVERFDSWSPVDSPMPTAATGGLAVDTERKSRLDVMIEDADLERELMLSIGQSVLPELQKAFCYRATRFERVKLVCYRAEGSGHFGTHRDNTAPSTAHRRFALTLNLNSEDYEGGELEFPEYGADCTYAVPTGSAILFACSHAHRLRPVTRGDRFALVTFAFGDEAVTPRSSAGSTAAR